MNPDRAAMLPLAFLVVALSLGIPAAKAEQVKQVRISHAERIADRLILEISTPGGPALEQDAFHITVNGLSVNEVKASSRFGTEKPAEIVLVIDTSSSMVGQPLAEARRAVGRFLETIEPKTSVALIRFSSTAEVVTPLTRNHERVRRGAATLAASGETAASDGVLQAIELGNERGSAQRTIVILSDGAGSTDDSVFDEAQSAARDKGVVISVVGIRSRDYAPQSHEADVAGPTTSARYARWGKLAMNTGGALVETADTTDLSQIFEDLATTLTSNYYVELTDPDPLAPTSNIDIKVEIESAVLTGSRAFSLPVLTQGSSPSRSPFDFEVPLPVFLAGLFLGVGGVAFIAADALRRKKVSPAERIAWYEDPVTRKLDTDALINAAVLHRAKEIATDLAGRTGYLERIEKEIEGAGMKWRPGEAIVASLLLALVGGFLGFALRGWPTGLFLALVGGLGPTLFIKNKASKRRRAFYKQLSDVLTLLMGGLRAGYSMQQACGAVADDSAPPASEEFRRVMAEVRLGSSLEDSLRSLARRVDIIDFDWTVLAIEIQREVGGDLGEILATIAETIRSRERLRGRVRTLTAEGRLSGFVLGGLPFVMGLAIFTKSPAYLDPLYQTKMGLMMVGGSVFMMIVGIFWMKKIVNIEV